MKPHSSTFTCYWRRDIFGFAAPAFADALPGQAADRRLAIVGHGNSIHARRSVRCANARILDRATESPDPCTTTPKPPFSPSRRRQLTNWWEPSLKTPSRLRRVHRNRFRLMRATCGSGLRLRSARSMIVHWGRSVPENPHVFQRNDRSPKNRPARSCSSAQACSRAPDSEPCFIVPQL